MRERWAPVQAHAAKLAGSKRKKDRDAALGELRAFHAELRGLRFLDPACGSGNFLYVTLHMVKRLELEVLRAIEEITGNPELGIEEVGPWQFHGIEIKPWAREIAELTLWIGYHQFWMEHHKGGKVPEPVLLDTKTLELRDAVLAWDEIVEVPEKSRPDPTPRIVHPVTGKLVPDPDARLPYYEYRGARQAEWPKAEFIVGNPPYLGTKRMRDAFGDGYVDALRYSYTELPDSADFVMYFWHRAASSINSETTLRSGLITTSSITNTQNRAVIAGATSEKCKVLWAVADHLWVEEAEGAAVRVAMTVLGRGGKATLVSVDSAGNPTSEQTAIALNPDLSTHADVTSAVSALQANKGISSFGFMINGGGFILAEAEADWLMKLDPANREIIRPYLNGRDLAARSRSTSIIDFALRSESEAAEYPLLFDIIRDRVRPHRVSKSDPASRKRWWQFARPREDLRTALAGLARYIATGETAKHRFFVFVERETAPDHMLVCIASDEPWHLGVLSSRIHTSWALAAGARLGVGNDPRYNKSVTFDPFPFPDPRRELREAIGRVAERLDQHRKDAIAWDERVTMTGMYNVVEKLRSGEALTPKERAVHEIAACGILRDMHDELDRLVAEAYGWPWPMEREEILERLVALHDERVEEEKRGIVRWLRPEYQIPRFGGAAQAALGPALSLADAAPAERVVPEAKHPWPAGAIDQIGACKALIAGSPAAPAEVAAAFAGAPVALVTRHLETLAMVGEVRVLPDGRYESVGEPL
ncbi:class I SAM-dependent DNA methyltransferase [Longimicrobium terrae]|uniref:site-specific DNA-methyltransferase (adenine-specific) n=2 Tax=Longimicrobium terrae TaxID=1639882 RepID=A0A841H225_9BACT|nr:class I SAM-dependent DNA methyltransferase [Longimicrobium terrae]MBB4637589.1 hypothetical protein [Longimicrobium terrae]MBB6071986.1 hypothetical protein [Longimicrobium terrae]NNC30530.1 class I SAM-dependent DNA methyltransferase [Longimicrobium terrae]